MSSAMTVAALRARAKLRQCAFGRVVGRESGIRERDRSDGVEVTEGYDVPWAVDDHVLRHRSGAAESGSQDPEFDRPRAVVLFTFCAHPAGTAASRAVDGDGIADREFGNCGAERVHDADAFVGERQRQTVGVLLFG